MLSREEDLVGEGLSEEIMEGLLRMNLGPVFYSYPLSWLSSVRPLRR